MIHGSPHPRRLAAPLKPSPRHPASAQLASYVELVERLVPATRAVGFFDRSGQCCGCSHDALRNELEALALRCMEKTPPAAAGRILSNGLLVAALPVQHEGRLVGALSVALTKETNQAAEALLASARAALQPVANVVAPVLQSATRPTKTQVLTERTEELEWLFSITAQLRSGSTECAAIEHLLAAAVERMQASFGGIAIPEKRISVTHGDSLATPDATLAYQSAHPHLMRFVQRRRRPLLINTPPPQRPDLAHVRLLALPLELRHGAVAGLIAFLRPISDPPFGRRQTYLGRHIARQVSAMLDSEYDLATGLFNRSALEQHVGRARSASPREADSLIYIDIDRLHLINDTFGFDSGDEVIVRIADLLHPPHVPSDAIAGRIAGDRFVVYLPGHDAAQAQIKAEGLRREAERITAGNDQQRIALSLSCGIARLGAEPHSFARYLAASELACKAAKDRGRNRSEIYLDIDQSMIRRRSDISGLARLRDALDHNRLRVYAQKIVPVGDRSRASGVECLVRLVEEDGTIVSPAAFMSAAQRYQQLKQVDEWVIRNTLELLAPFASVLFHSGMYASINISGQSLGDEAFLKRIEQWIRNSNVAPGLITFEITETAAVSNLQRSDELMRDLKRLGCRFALDDFGTGVNSLSYLKSLPVDRVKIDGSFVKDIATNPRSEAMVRAVVQLARSLEIDCVAEFVHSDAVLKKVRDLGVGYAQGYLMHEPEPLANVLRALTNDESRRVRKLSLEI